MCYPKPCAISSARRWVASQARDAALKAFLMEAFEAASDAPETVLPALTLPVFKNIRLGRAQNSSRVFAYVIRGERVTEVEWQLEVLPPELVNLHKKNFVPGLRTLQEGE